MSAAFSLETNAEPEAPESVRIAARNPPSLSEQLWGLDWRAVLPHHLDGGFSVVRSRLERSKPFILEHYAAIFEESEDSPFAPRVTGSKERYYELCDFFEILQGGDVVGLVIGAPSDWSTYYVRSAALLPAHQGSGVIQRLFSRVLFGELMRVGVERVEVDVSPANLAMVHIVTRLAFNVTGTTLTERWGANTRFTKYLCPESAQVFLTQFCSGVKYQLRDARLRAIPRSSEP
jgi:hypothetical protein